jgi:hypothetical protein
VKKAIFIFSILVLSGCVSGAPYLTEEQNIKSKNIQIYRDGDVLDRSFNLLDEVKAADCSALPWGMRIYGNEEKSIEILKAKAAALDANAVVNVTCRVIPYLNNCWASRYCIGTAVVWK